MGFDRDFEQYVEFYNEIGAGETSRFEFAFVLLGKIVQAFFGTGYSSLINLDFSFLVFLYIVAFISVSIKVYLLSKRSKFYCFNDHILSDACATSGNDSNEGWDSYRSDVLRYLSCIDKNLTIPQRLLYVILGLGFHQSTILLAPIYFILKSSKGIHFI